MFAGAAVFQHLSRALTAAIMEGSALAQNLLPVSAVYVIICQDGRAYVGSSTSIKDRWKFHRTSLRRGKSSNSALQRAWTELGEGAFEFRILEECDPEALIATEQKWIDTYLARGPLFNRALVAGSNAGVTATPETRAKMSASRRGRVASEATLQRLSEAKSGERHPGAKLTEDLVREIRRLLADGVTHQRLADTFGVSRPTVSFIASRKRWANV